MKLLVILTFLLFSTSAFPWTVKKNSNGITVSTRSVQGSSFDEFRATMTIRSNTYALLKIVTDIEIASQWIDSCDHAELVEEISDTEYITYTLSNTPWPVKDRDTVLLNKIRHNDSTGVITIEGVARPNAFPKRRGTVRVQTANSLWKFTPRDGGLVEIHYQVLSNPGGNIPAWLVNQAVIDQPFNTLKNLRRLAE